MIESLAPNMICDNKASGFKNTWKWIRQFMKHYMSWTFRVSTIIVSKLALKTRKIHGLPCCLPNQGVQHSTFTLALQQGPICEASVSNCTLVVIVIIVVVVGGKLFEPKPMEVEFFVLGVAINLRVEHGGLMCILNPICPLEVCQTINHIWKFNMKK